LSIKFNELYVFDGEYDFALGHLVNLEI
jgi:hypothetical protein